MTSEPAPLLKALAECALAATPAAKAWIVTRRGDELWLAAAAGDERAPVGTAIPQGIETVGFVVASGQTFSVAPHSEPGDFPAGLGSLTADPPAPLICLPCLGHDGVAGALELAAEESAEAFSGSQIAAAGAVAHAIGVAISQMDEAHVVPSPTLLAQELERLQELDPLRYRHIAAAVSALLGHA